MQFLARVGTSDGRVRVEELEAPDETSLRGELERRGLHIFEVERRGMRVRLPALRGGRRRLARIPLDSFLIFNQELAALLRAGLPLLQALDILLERGSDSQFRSVLGEIRDRVKSGEELSDAFASFGSMFPPLYASTLKAGERSGELEGVIRRFIRYSKLVIDARKRVVSALVYPAVLVVLSIVMICVMLLFVLPKFTVFYEDMEAQLPMLTRITLSLANGLRANWLVLLLGIGGGFLAFRQWRETEAGRITIDRLKLQLPFLGLVLQRFSVSEFSRSLATLLAGGIPLVPALEIAVRAVSNAYIRHRLQPAIQAVREGKAFYAALVDTKVVSDLAIDMVKVGETTGALDTMLSSVSDFFDEEVETRMQRILSLIEPLMLVFMGIIVAALLVSVYLPMFSILGQVR